MKLRLTLIILLLFSFVAAQQSAFVLCEGNFNSLNASLWSINSDHSEITGPIHWNPPADPLGDTGQSVYVHNNKLYIVMNNSNTIEIGDISSGFQYEATIDVPSSGPRDIEIIENTAYISCWYLNGILLVDINNYKITDTLFVNGLPEDLLYYNDKLYASITMNPDRSASDKVIEIDISNEAPVITNTFTVITGPGQLLVYNQSLFVSSVYFDAQGTYSGISKIDLNTGEVTSKDYGIYPYFGMDISIFQGNIYLVCEGGAVPLKEDLAIDLEKKIGNLSGIIYSMSAFKDHLFFGLSNYIAPDTVIILDTLGNQAATFKVGACPGSFAFYEPSQNHLDDAVKAVYSHSFSLGKNFPNPFNNVTSIPYRIEKESKVKISIYNLLGQHVIDLVNSYQVGGEYLVTWNGIDKTGLSVANGLYFCMLEGKQFRLMKKMIYLK